MIRSAVVLAVTLMAAALAVAQEVGQGFDQDSNSGVVDQSFTVAVEGSVADQCSALLAAA